MTISKRLTIYLHGQSEADLEQALEAALRGVRRGHVVGSSKGETSEFRFEVDDIALDPTEAATLDDVGPRVYLAVHAPALIPDWFQPELPPLPKIMPLWTALEQQPRYSDLPKMDKERLREWMDNRPRVDLDDHLAPIAKAGLEDHEASHEAYKKAQRDRERARCIAWPWYWADQMIAASATNSRVSG
jgi:hypothetical protein